MTLHVRRAHHWVPGSSAARRVRLGFHASPKTWERGPDRVATLPCISPKHEWSSIANGTPNASSGPTDYSHCSIALCRPWSTFSPTRNARGRPYLSANVVPVALPPHAKWFTPVISSCRPVSRVMHMYPSTQMNLPQMCHLGCKSTSVRWFDAQQHRLVLESCFSCLTAFSNSTVCIS